MKITRSNMLRASLLGIVTGAAGSCLADGENLNRFSVSGTFSFNLHAKFQGAVNTPPGANGLGSYDNNQFIAQGIAGNVGKTTNYRFDPASYDRTTGNLDLKYTPAPTGSPSRKTDDDPRYGFEVNYGRQLGTLGGGMAWGLGAGVGYTSLDISEAGLASGNVTQSAYQFTGPKNILFPAGTQVVGSFTGPGPLFTFPGVKQPDATVASQVALTDEISGALVAVKFGPWLEIPLCKVARLDLSGGLALGYADVDYSWKQSVSTGGAVVGSTSAAHGTTSFLPGGFVEAKLAYLFTETVELHVGAQYRYLENLKVRSGGKEASIGLGEAISVVLGIGYSF